MQPRRLPSPRMLTKTEKSEQTLAAIVDEALTMAGIDGLGSLSLGEIAKRVGISKSGVFARVGSLEALQAAVLEEYERRFSALIFEPALAQPRGLPRLHAMMMRWIEVGADPRGLGGSLHAAGAFQLEIANSGLRDRLLHGSLNWRRVLARAVSEARDAGHLRPDTDPEQLAYELFGLMMGYLHDARFDLPGASPQRVRLAYARLMSTYRGFAADTPLG